MPRNKPRRLSGSSRATAHSSHAAEARRLEPPGTIARRLAAEFSNFLPAAEELERRYQLIGKQLAQYGSLFDAECTSSRTSPCWLLDHQDAWNTAINNGGVELRCHRQGRLFLSMVPLFLDMAPTLRLMETTSTLLAVLWLLNSHQCIEYANVNADVAFGVLSRPFFALVHFRAEVRRLHVTARLPFNATPSNDDLFSLSLGDIRSLESLTLNGTVLSQFATTNITRALASNDCTLTYVCLRGIYILRNSMEDLLSSLRECRRVKTLDLAIRVGCPGLLRSLEELIESTRDLEEFRYELNGPVRFPFHTLFKNRTLKILCVGEEIFDADDIRDLANTLNRNKRLRYLGISLCPLEDHLALWSIFTAGVVRNSTLKELDMQASEITDVAAGFLFEALKLNNTLEKLNAATGKLSANAAKLFAQLLLTNTSLQEIRIGRVEGEKAPLAELFNVLQDPLVSNRVVRVYTETQLATLIKLMRQRCQQKEVHVCGTHTVGSEPIHFDLVSNFFFGLRVQKHLTYLTVSMNATLMSHSAHHLAFLFKNSVTLKDVDLYVATKSPEIKVICEGIRQSGSILRLRIREWFFDVQSADAFMEMLKENRSIYHLTLFRWNEGADYVIARLSEALDENHGIMAVDLFDQYDLRIMCFQMLPQLRRNFFRLSRAAAFLKGEARDQESADDFRRLALSEALMKRLKDDGESTEEEIKTVITEKLAKMRL
ncbi:unnamed protein product [Ixodes hexagonus]